MMQSGRPMSVLLVQSHKRRRRKTVAGIMLLLLFALV